MFSLFLHFRRFIGNPERRTKASQEKVLEDGKLLQTRAATVLILHWLESITNVQGHLLPEPFICLEFSF